MRHVTAALCSAAFIGGMALASSANAQVGFGFGFGPGYGYGYPAYRRDYDYGPRRVYRSYDYDDDCRIVVRRRVDPWGRVVVRRVRVCD